MRRRITTKVLVHWRNRSLIHIATALVTRTRGLRLRCHRQHRMLWQNTMEKVRRNLLYGRTTRSSLSCSSVVIVVFVVSYNYLRHVRFSPESCYRCLAQDITCHFMCCKRSIMQCTTLFIFECVEFARSIRYAKLREM